MPMAASPPTPARAASAATAMVAAPGARTTNCSNAVCQKRMPITRRRRPPRTQDKRISVRKFKGCETLYPKHQNVSSKDVLDIKLSTHPDKCLNDVRTQFSRQRARMRSAHWHTVLAPTRAHARRALCHGRSRRGWLARSSTDTHVSWRGARY